MASCGTMFVLDSIDSDAFYDLRQAAEALGVSQATIRNWTRSKLLSPQRMGRSLAFPKSDVEGLRAQIQSGSLKRLKSRANKNENNNVRLHSELAEKAVIDAVTEIARALAEEHDSVPAALCALALGLAEQSGAFTTAALIRQEANAQGLSLTPPNAVQLQELGALEPYLILAVAYQHLSSDGQKAVKGAIYTPPATAALICDELIGGPVRYMDPCCGSGVFLVAAIRRFKALGIKDWKRFISGCDIDPHAVLCARLSCFFEVEEGQSFGTDDIEVYEEDALGSGRLRSAYGSYDLVATNPPWGATYPPAAGNLYKGYFPDISSGESFSYFTALAFKLLRPGGQYSFLLPEAALTTNYHRDLREMLLGKAALAVHDLGRLFSGLLTKVVRVDAVNQPAHDQHIIFHTQNTATRIPRSDIQSDEDRVMSLVIKSQHASVLDRIRSRESYTLKDRATFALGIVTGNNARFVKPECAEGMEPVYRGRDISPYRLGEPNAFLRFAPDEFQQCAAEHLFRAPQKLVYRFISKDLCFTLDTRGSLTLNSANLLIPEQGLSPLFVLGALNSTYANFYFRTVFNSVKVLRRHLESIPIPALPQNQVAEVEDYARQALAAEDPSPFLAAIDRIFNDYYGVQSDELRA